MNITRTFAAAILIAVTLVAGQAAAQTREPYTPDGCTSDGNCGGDPRAEPGR